MTSQAKRLLWIVNHQTLMPAELPILLSLGWEVFVPKIIPSHNMHYRSGSTSFEFDASLTIDAAALNVLNRHQFYEQDWSPTIERVINENFQVLVATFTYFLTPLSEAARKFNGLIIARVFGREHPARYSNLPPVTRRPDLLQELSAISDRFIFGQGYANLAEIEDEPLRSRGHTITVPLPGYIFKRQNSWTGTGSSALFLCPATTDNGYYQAIYDGMKLDFGDLPHQIFGRQVGPVTDPAILPYLTDDELLDVYGACPVFAYPSTEPRHVHYSPLEAMVVGAPVLYRQGALIDVLAGNADLPGRCIDTAEMRIKAKRLLGGDRQLAEAIRSSQKRILSGFEVSLARQQWAEVLPATSESVNNGWRPDAFNS